LSATHSFALVFAREFCSRDCESGRNTDSHNEAGSHLRRHAKTLRSAAVAAAPGRRAVSLISRLATARAWASASGSAATNAAMATHFYKERKIRN